MQAGRGRGMEKRFRHPWKSGFATHGKAVSPSMEKRFRHPWKSGFAIHGKVAFPRKKNAGKREFSMD
jgi:hypothetical protein